VILWLIFAGIALVAGISALTPATYGVGGVCIGCFFLILARIAQANAHQRVYLQALAGEPKPSERT
jgi:hypothetical protein